jgi:mannan endo-1,4-beta-mannosidase
MYLRKHISVMVVFCMVLSILATSFVWLPAVHAAENQPVNPNATQEAKDLLYYLNSIEGSKIVSGMFNYQNNSYELTHYTNDINNLSGKYPGLYGQDFAYKTDTWTIDEQRQALTDECISQYADGAMIALCWHMPRPDKDNATAGWEAVHNSYGAWMDDATVRKFVTPGTTEYNQLIARLDAGAVYLKQLKDADVPVLWRPFHEMNYGYFWWGGRAYEAKEFWKIMYDRYVNYHHLDNLIWVWNVSERWDSSTDSAFANFYPGSQYVDMLSVDIYADSHQYSQTTYTELRDVDTTKPCAIGENSFLPDPDYTLSNGQNYVYYMTWGNCLYTNPKNGGVSNTDADINSIHNHADVLTRDEVGIGPAPTPTPTPTSTPTPPPAGNWVTVDDRNSSITYNGTWTEDTWSSDIDGTEKYSNQTNAYAQFAFTGTGVQWYGYKQNNLGKADVYIDNVKQATIDLYDPSMPAAAPRTMLYEKSGLTSGSHTIKLVVTGTKNASSSGYYVLLDAFKYINTPPAAGTWVKVDDGDSSASYDTGWGAYNGNPGYQSTEHWSKTSGSIATYAFTGTQARYYGFKRSDSGIAEIYIDNVLKDTIDCYSSTSQYDVLLFESAVLPAGTHTLKVKVKGTKNPSSTGIQINCDAFACISSNNLIRNPELDNGTANWFWMQSDTGSGSMSAVTGAGLSGTNALKVTFTNGGTNPWNAQVNQNFAITSGKTYKISFMAKAAAARTMNVMLQQSTSPYTAYWNQTVNLTTTAQSFGPYTFTCNTTDADSVLRFNLGGNASTVYIDSVVITE